MSVTCSVTGQRCPVVEVEADISTRRDGDTMHDRDNAARLAASGLRGDVLVG